MANYRDSLYSKTKRRGRPLSIYLLIGLVCSLCFWGMNGHASHNPSWLTFPTHLYQYVAVENPALDPDPLSLVVLPEKQPDTALTDQMLPIIQQFGTNLKPHVYYLNLKTGDYVNINADEPVPAASVIKLPLLLEYFRAMGDGKIKPNDPLLYDFIHQAGGSGELQYKPPGQMLSSLDLARIMIQISDNSATNIFIDNLGGMSELNERFHRMGLSQTHLRNWLPDLEGTNTISTRDMSSLLYNVAFTGYLCKECKDEALLILQGTHNKRLIPAGLPPGTPVFHKTGDIGTSLGDSALVTLPDGNAYLLSIQVQRPYNDYSAKELIIALSKTVYEHQSTLAIGRLSTDNLAMKQH